LRVWRGGEGFGKKEGASGRNRRHWEERALKVNFFIHNTKSLSFGELKNCTERRFLRVYVKFSKSIYCYNILKIKNILIISISLSFSKKLFFVKCKRLIDFLYISNP